MQTISIKLTKAHCMNSFISIFLFKLRRHLTTENLGFVRTKQTGYFLMRVFEGTGMKPYNEK